MFVWSVVVTVCTCIKIYSDSGRGKLIYQSDRGVKKRMTVFLLIFYLSSALRVRYLGAASRSY